MTSVKSNRSDYDCRFGKHIVLSDRDFQRALDLLENPPPLTEKAIAAIKAMPKLPRAAKNDTQSES